MAGYPGSTIVTGPLSLSDVGDVYETHWDILGFGGHRAVATIVERDAIPIKRRKFGMTVTVNADPTPANNKTYMLANTALGGTNTTLTDNTNWVTAYSAGGGGGVTDGDKGDITVSGSGSTWTVDGGYISLTGTTNLTGNKEIIGSEKIVDINTIWDSGNYKSQIYIFGDTASPKASGYISAESIDGVMFSGHGVSTTESTRSAGLYSNTSMYGTDWRIATSIFSTSYLSADESSYSSTLIIEAAKQEVGVDLVSLGTGFAITGINSGNPSIQGIIVYDDANSIGMFYKNNYSANNISNPRWIPDKAYVDGKLGTISSGGVDVAQKSDGAGGFAASNLQLIGAAGSEIAFFNGLGFNFETTLSNYITRFSGSNTSSISVLGLERSYTGVGTIVAGFGSALYFALDRNSASVTTTGLIENIYTDATAGSEDTDFVFKLMSGGTTPTEKIRFTSDGNIILGSTKFIGISGATGAVFFDTNRTLLNGGTAYIDIYNTNITLTSNSSPNRFTTITNSTNTTAGSVIRHETTNTPAPNIGASLGFEVETSASNFEYGAAIEAIASIVTGGSEAFDLSFKTMSAGGFITEKVLIRAKGGMVITQESPSGTFSSGTEVLILKSTVSSDDPTIRTHQCNILGSGGGGWGLNIPTTNDTVYLVKVTIVARRTGGSAGSAGDGASYCLVGTFTNNGGVLSQIGTTTTLWAHESQPGWNVTLSASGTNVDIVVFGAINNNITWHIVSCEISPVSS